MRARRSVFDNTIMQAVGALKGDIGSNCQWSTGLAWRRYKLSTAPSLYRLYAKSAGGGAVNDCPVTQAAPCNGDRNLRINGRVSWQMGGHLLSAAVRYYGPIEKYDSQTALNKLAKIDSWAPDDVNYADTFELATREVQVGVGSQNAFGEKEPYMPYPSFQPFILPLHDTRGRSAYAKASVTF